MRWLTARIKTSAKDRHDERGAVMVLVALLLVALVGFGAIAIDVGRVAAEKAQLQNGADASALAIAHNCAGTQDLCYGAPNPLADSYTLGNSNSSTAVAPSVTFPAANRVTVLASTPEGGLSLTLARVLGIATADITATATAAWAPPGNGSSFPLTFSNKCFDLKPDAETGAVQQFRYKPGSECTGPSGTHTGGGWGWLDNLNCEATSDAGTDSFGSDPGNDLPNGCEAILKEWVSKLQANEEVIEVFPIFDTVSTQGQKAVYHVVGYATFSIVGWKLAGGSNKTPGAFQNTAEALTSLGINPSYACSDGNDRCVIAKFIRYDVEDPTVKPGEGADFGTTVVALVE